MIVIRIFLMVLLAGTIAASHAPSAVGQSDETCVAYMEADAAYEPARREFESALAVADKASASFRVALNALRYARAAHEVALQNAADPRYANLPDLTDHERAKRDVEIAHSEYAIASAAWRKAWDDLVDISASTKPARKKWAWAYSAAYDGPISAVDSVMEKLIAADRERCRERLERR